MLETILGTKIVTDGCSNYPLHSHISAVEGAVLQQLIGKVQPDVSLEVGMAYGISTLFICEALAQLNKPCREYREVIENPDQDGYGIGIVKWDGRI